MIQGGSGKNFGSLLHSKFNFAGTCQECCSRVPGRVCKDTLIQLADVLVGFLLSSRLNHQCWASQVVHLHSRNQSPQSVIQQDTKLDRRKVRSKCSLMFFPSCTAKYLGLFQVLSHLMGRKPCQLVEKHLIEATSYCRDCTISYCMINTHKVSVFPTYYLWIQRVVMCNSVMEHDLSHMHVGLFGLRTKQCRATCADRAMDV